MKVLVVQETVTHQTVSRQVRLSKSQQRVDRHQKMKKNGLPWRGMFLLKINLDNECVRVHSVFQTFLHLKYFESTQIKMAENNSIYLHISLTLFHVCHNRK